MNLETSRLYEFFPEYDYIDWFQPYTIGEDTYTKADITLRDLLTMSAGLEWDEATVHYGDPENTLRIMMSSDDPFEYLFERPLVSVPGEEHVYNSGLSNAIIEVIERSAGQTIGDFARDNLFTPIGVNDFYWEGGLALRPRDMLKFGQLFLNQGQWDGEQIVSSGWVTQSLEKVYDFGSGQRTTGYGYQWWWNEFEVDGVRYEAHAALGYGGQQILIFPDFDMVVVFTATEFPRAWGNKRTPYMWMTDFIVPAIINAS